KISSIQHQEGFDFSSRLSALESSLMKQVYKNDLAEGLFNSEVSILDLLNAGGAALVSPRQIKTTGDVPTADQIKEIVYWLQSNPQSDIFHVSNLAEVYESAEAFSDVASGIIAIPIDPAKGEYIIGFRPEAIQEVNWGGNPNEAINFEKDNITYHPRNSFRLWQQVVKNTSLPWKAQEVTAAGNFRNFILNLRAKN
ncbi:MAG: hypothetical protein WCF67_25605, partial [Chitinophagaceae bacterium]